MADKRAAADAHRPSAGAIIYCEGAFAALDGKTTHGLVRRSQRYRVLAVIDSDHSGADAGTLLDGRRREIPIVADLASALAVAADGVRPTHLVIGLAPIRGVLDQAARDVVAASLAHGLHVHCGLHELLGDDRRLVALAAENGVELVDVRRAPERSALHRFSGKIEQVTSTRVAILGVDSAIGKRTTAWLLVDELRRRGRSVELVGTGQTAWLQGAEFCVPLDALIYDFVPGEIEHAVWSAWHERRPDVLVLEGQGGLLSPGYFGGQELLLAARPHSIVLQHAPGRAEYDGCPGYPIDPLARQLEALRGMSRAPIAAITVSREGADAAEMPALCAAITAETGIAAIDVLDDSGAASGARRLYAAVAESLAGLPETPAAGR